MIILPDGVAAEFRAEIRQQIASRSYQIRLLGFLVAGDPASEAYAEYTRSGCQDVGIEFEVRKIKASDVEQAIRHANNDNSIHGIFVYYPIYRDERDSQLKDLISHKKDVEGLGSYWMKKLYENVRFDDDAKTRKAILPCTPLAILKLLEREISPLNGTRSFEGRRITIFNRSEVVGRPLAYMLKNDGATVFSFDVDGGWALSNAPQPAAAERAKALQESEIVITGVPSTHFPKIQDSELRADAICLNFSYIQNFDESVKQSSRKFITRVGTLTVAMCLRNAVRLYEHHLSQEGKSHARG